MIKKRHLLRLSGGLFAMCIAGVCFAEGATVLYKDRVVQIQNTLADPTDLWVQPEDLTRINDFVLKPEGACLEEICIPLRQDQDNEIVITRSEQQWFNVTEFANKLEQSYVADYESSTWSFGEMPIHRSDFLDSAKAPDFELKDRDGNIVKLSDFRGKKVFLGTWASW
ncbi:hypothetical protein NBRC116493_25380 [Aurantivibrio infirmus]